MNTVPYIISSVCSVCDFDFNTGESVSYCCGRHDCPRNATITVTLNSNNVVIMEPDNNTCHICKEPYISIPKMGISHVCSEK